MSEAGFRNFYEELKRRRVIRVGTLYTLIFWPLISVVDILAAALNLPDLVIRYLLFAYIGSLPIVLVSAWMFDMNRGGIQRDDGEEHPPLINPRTELILIIGLSLFVIGLLFVQLRTPDEPAPEVVQVARSLNSIAVLPFASFSEEKRDQYFADGLTEELLNSLARITDLKVAARTSSFAYKDVSRNVSDIGRELNVATILEGSVRRNDINDTIRVTAQLIDVADGSHLWSQTFDREFNDVFKIQDEIAGAVSQSLQRTLLDRPGNQPSNTSSTEALIAYSMGQEALSSRTEQDMLRAIDFFGRAVEEDPGYAEAYAGMADAQTLLVNYGYAPAESLATADQSVSTALELDPNLGIAWASRGLLEQQQGDWPAARKSLERAIELNPSYAMAYMWYAAMLETDSEQLDYYRRASDLDPRSPVAAYNVANLLARQGNETEAMQMFGRIIDANPSYGKAYTLVGGISERNGRLMEAISNYREAYELQPSPWLALDIGRLYVDIGEFEQADAWFSLGDSEDDSKHSSALRWNRLARYIAAGDQAKANGILAEIVGQSPRHKDDVKDQIVAAYFLKDYETVLTLAEEINFDQQQDHMDHFGEKILDTYIAIAFAYRETGKLEQMNELIADITEMLDSNAEHAIYAKASDQYRRALTAAMSGDRTQVLIRMQLAIDEGWREYWRPPLEPALVSLVDAPDLQAMLAGLATRLNIMSDQYRLDAEFAGGW